MIRRLAYWFLMAAFIALVATRFNEFSDFSHILERGQYQWVLVAVVLQVFHYLVSSASYQSSFTIVGVHTRLRDLFPLLFGSIFVNVVAPAGGASGAALFVDHAARSGQSPARTAAGVFVQLITSMIAVAVVITAGLAYLGFQDRLETYDLVAALFFVLSTGFLAGLLLLTIKRPLMLRFVLFKIQKFINAVSRRIKHVTLVSDEKIEQHLGDFTNAGAAITASPARLAMTIGTLLFAHLINLAVLYSLFLAFRESISVGSLLAGYSVGILFLIVSLTPQGIGVVEGIMPVVFKSLGVPTGVATLTVLAFRGLSLWLPLIFGFFLLRWIKTFRPKEPLPVYN